MALTVSYAAPTAKVVIVMLNPLAGWRPGRPLVDALHRSLKAQGYQVEVLTDLDDMAAACEATIQAGLLRTVVTAGGDGTALAVVNRIPGGVPLTVLPLGTENLLAKHITMTAEPERVAEVIRAGVTVRLDAGRAGERIFLVMGGCGFDAEVVRRMHGQRRGHIHRLSYTRPIFETVRQYQYPELRLHFEVAPGEAEVASPHTHHYTIHARWVFVANLPGFALGLNIVPRVDGSDGLLDICAFQAGSFWAGIRYLGGVLLRRHVAWHDCIVQRVRRVRIEADEAVPYQLDGDPAGVVPVELEAVPERLTLMVPAGWAARQRLRHSA